MTPGLRLQYVARRQLKSRYRHPMCVSCSLYRFYLMCGTYTADDRHTQPCHTVKNGPPKPKRKVYPNLPVGAYYAHKYAVDLFPDPPLVKQNAGTDYSTTSAQFDAFLSRAKNEGFPDER